MIIHHKKFEFRNKILIEKVTVKAPFRFNLDFQNDACFVHFQKGETMVNAPYEQIMVSSGNSILLKCGRYFSDLENNSKKEPFEVLVIHLSKELLQEIYRDDFPPITSKRSSMLARKIDDQTIINEFIKGLEFYLDHPDLVNDSILELKVKELILILLQSQIANSISSLFENLFSPSLIEILEVVNSHIYDDLSVSDLAYLCNLSESTFKRRFKEKLSDTPSNYIRKKRIGRAKELLKIDSVSISEVAYKVGFKDIAHFSRTFKKETGCSPSQFKEEH